MSASKSAVAGADGLNGKPTPGVGLIEFARGKPVKLAGQAAPPRLRQTQAGLRQGRNLELLGRHTCKISHDFKNLLAVIDGNLQIMVATSSSRRDRLGAVVADALQATRLLSELVEDLLAFVGRGSSERAAVDLGALARQTRRLLKMVAGDGIHLDIDCALGLTVDVVPARFQSALIELAANARDAMQGRGEITLRVAPGALADAPPSAPGPHATRRDATRCAMVTLEDSGLGIDPDAATRLFEPFASGKPNGHGIGLTAVRDFAEQMGGTAWIEALPGRGTRAGFCIPIAERPARTGGRSGAQGRQRWPRPKAS